MAPIRRAPIAAAPAVEGINFGSLGFYAGGFLLPKGRYVAFWDVRNHQAMKSDGTPFGKARLGVMMTAYPLLDDGTVGEPQEQFFGMGSKADQSFAPDPNTGKGLVAIPGAPSTSMNNKTNWALMLKSLYDCGLPEGIFSNDLTTIDGTWIVTDNVPEPEDRKGFAQSQTGEAAESQERKGPGLVPVCAEILEGGKPWEGTGGLPEAAPAKPAGAAGPKPVPVKPAVARPAARPTAAPAPAPVAEATDEDAAIAALNGMTVVLSDPANANGTTKLKLRTGTFKAVSAAMGGEMAQAVLDTYFATDDALNSILGQLGYVVKGVAVSPA